MAKNVLVVGGGASGMMAAYSASLSGNKVILCERNEKLGKKIYITGKGRCNLTNCCDTVDFFDNVFENSRFLYSAVYGFDSSMLLETLAEGGLKTKVERGNRVFPVSDKASDVTKALAYLLKSNGVEIRLNTNILHLDCENNHIKGAVSESGELILADAVILCCGGKSYPSTGSDGNGYRLAKQLGHDIIPTGPALTPIITKENWVGELAGLSLKNIEVTLLENGKKKCSEFGEMLFTHNGLSGPVILTLSCLVNENANNVISIDLKPALSEKKLDDRLLRDFSMQSNKDFKNSLGELLPSSLCPVIVKRSGIPAEKKINQITQEERQKLLRLIKSFNFEIEDLGGFNEAIITRGGVDTKQVDPSTMGSRLISGLYFAGEMLATHGFTGGFNLQIAFSTGYLAGSSV